MTVIGAAAVRVTIKRGYVNHHLARQAEIDAAASENWIRRDLRCRTPTYRVTSHGRAAFPDVKPSGGSVATRTRGGW